MQKIYSFLGFQNYVKRFIPNHSTLKYTRGTLERTLQKKVDFDRTGPCNEIYIESIVYADTTPYGVSWQNFYKKK